MTDESYGSLSLPNEPINEVTRIAGMVVMDGLKCMISSYGGWLDYKCCWIPNIQTAKTNIEPQYDIVEEHSQQKYLLLG